MRKTTLVIASALALTLASAPNIAVAQVVDGTITKIDQAQNRITLRHGPIKKLDMDMPMTMVFRAKDPAMLNDLKEGDKVKFEADRVNGQLTVISIRKAN